MTGSAVRVPLRWLDDARPPGSPAARPGGCRCPGARSTPSRELRLREVGRASTGSGADARAENAAGAEVAAQFWPLATWPDGSVKWAGVAIGAMDAPTAYEVVSEAAASVPGGAPASGQDSSAPRVTVRHDDAEVVVANGDARDRLRAARARPRRHDRAPARARRPHGRGGCPPREPAAGRGARRRRVRPAAPLPLAGHGRRGRAGRPGARRRARGGTSTGGAGRQGVAAVHGALRGHGGIGRGAPGPQRRVGRRRRDTTSSPGSAYARMCRCGRRCTIVTCGSPARTAASSPRPSAGSPAFAATRAPRCAPRRSAVRPPRRSRSGTRRCPSVSSSSRHGAI